MTGLCISSGIVPIVRSRFAARRHRIPIGSTNSTSGRGTMSILTSAVIASTTVPVWIHVCVWYGVCAWTARVALVPSSQGRNRHSALLHVEKTPAGEFASVDSFRHAEVVCECEEVEGVAERDRPFENSCVLGMSAHILSVEDMISYLQRPWR